jgi:hypothetical protein
VRPVLLILTALATLLASFGLAAPTRGAEPAKVAIIVGPVGEELTPTYIALADAAAAAATERGATVATAYSPDATAEKVLAAVEGASIVVYFGHGIGTPNPYSDTPNPASVNGWGLNGAKPNGHHDSVADGALAYYGEAWIAEHAEPAPGWVMIYSNACYAPGAGEGQHEPADEATAADRVAAYSRAPLAELGASAYFATDFYEGAAQLIGTLLDQPALPYGDVFAADPHFIADGLTRFDHPDLDGAETWLHYSPYFEGKNDYWYAFAGDPDASLSGAMGASTVAATGDAASAGTAAADADEGPIPVVDGVVTGKASSYSESVGYEGQPTVALPLEIGGIRAGDTPTWVMVCADRCASIPVVDSCPCYVGTPEQRVANLSHAAWALISDMPLAEGLIDVEVYLSPVSDPAPQSPGWRGPSA